MPQRTMNPPRNKPPPPLCDILFFLGDIGYRVRKNRKFCLEIKVQLEEYGYDWFDNISNERTELKEQVMKVLAVAVNEAIQKKVDLRNKNSKMVNQELHKLLDINENKSLGDYFLLSSLKAPAFMLQTAQSPVDMTGYVKEGAPQWLVKKIIQYQFDIRWQTDTGESADYKFSKFCDKKNTIEHFKYIPRQAHVKAMLYKEHRKESVNDLRSITKEELCPKVYIKTTRGWKAWQAAEGDEADESDSTDESDSSDESDSCDESDSSDESNELSGEFNDVNIENDLSWINPSIHEFITENADEQKAENLKGILAKPTLYWAVMDNTADFEPGDNLQLKQISKTQVYVGLANNGIHGRWIKDANNHCAMMKKCLDNVCAMTIYDPLRLEGIQLVDARLALAEVREENTALFVIKTFGDDFEKVEIALQNAKACLCKVIESLKATHFSDLSIINLHELAKKYLCHAQESCRKSCIIVEKCLGQAHESCRESFIDAETSLGQAHESCSRTLIKAKNDQSGTQESNRSSGRRKAKTSLRPQAQELSKEAKESLRQVKEAEKSFNAATATLQKLIDQEQDVKKQMNKLNKTTAKKDLEKAEKCHRHGKRVDGTGIIQNVDDIEWLPKDMRYGMNNK